MIERIRQMIEYYGLNMSQFEQKISVSNGTIRSAIARNRGLNSDVLIKILEINHEISPDWLLLGKGEMLRQNSQNCTQFDPLDMVSLEKYEKKVEECALLRAELNSIKEQAALYAKEKTASFGTIIPTEG